jgi:hypothetical protein
MSSDKILQFSDGQTSSPIVAEKSLQNHPSIFVFVSTSGSVYITQAPTRFHSTAKELGWLK